MRLKAFVGVVPTPKTAFLPPASSAIVVSPKALAETIREERWAVWRRQHRLLPRARSRRPRSYLCQADGPGDSVGDTPRLAVTAIGALAGIVGSLVGAGGGVVIIPLATAFLRLSQHQAHGTSLAAVTCSATVASVGYFRVGGFVDWTSAGLITTAGLITASAGASSTANYDARQLRRRFGMFLVAVSAVLLSRALWLPGEGMLSWQDRRFATLPVLALGLGTGYISGLLGVGGGTLVVPAMTLLFGMNQKMAQGTALAAMIAPSLRGALTHFRLGHVVLRLLPWLILGSTFGSLVGSFIATRIADAMLRVVCAGVFFVIGLRYISGSVTPGGAPRGART